MSAAPVPFSCALIGFLFFIDMLGRLTDMLRKFVDVLARFAEGKLICKSNLQREKHILRQFSVKYVFSERHIRMI